MDDAGGEPRMSSSDRNAADFAGRLPDSYRLPDEPLMLEGALSSGGYSMSEPVKKKRGRPRKYGSDGSISLALASPSAATSGYSSEPSAPRRRGRPPGSGKKQQLHALGTAGIGFTPHVIVVNPGEDVAAKIAAFSQQGPRTICIVSAVGAISNVTLRQPSTLGGTVTVEGRFEILSLAGSFHVVEKEGGEWTRTGSLSVSLAGADCRVLGGAVAGALLAASPVQVVVASFIPEARKPKPKPKPSQPQGPEAPPPDQILPPTAAAAPTTPSQGTSSELSDGGVSPRSWPLPAAP